MSVSVLVKVIEPMKNVSGKDFKVFMDERRAGDPSFVTVDNQFDGLRITHTLEDMCRSAYEVELKRDVL